MREISPPTAKSNRMPKSIAPPNFQRSDFSHHWLFTMVKQKANTPHRETSIGPARHNAHAPFPSTQLGTTRSSSRLVHKAFLSVYACAPIIDTQARGVADETNVGSLGACWAPVRSRCHRVGLSIIHFSSGSCLPRFQSDPNKNPSQNSIFQKGKVF